jgi:hypothetical protein
MDNSIENEQDDIEPSENEKELIAFVVDHTDRWREYRNQNHLDNWERYERIFRGVWEAGDKLRESERSRVISPATQQAIETRHAEIMEAIFGQGEFFDIKDDILDENKNPVDVEMLKALLNEDFKKDKIVKSIDQIELMAEIYGTGIGEIVISEETVYTPHTQPISDTQVAFGALEGKRVVIKLNPINPKNFLFDPNGTSVDDCMGVAIERYTSIHKIMANIESGVYRDVDISTFYKTDELEPTQETTNFKDQKILLLTYYGLVPSEYMKPDGEDTSLLVDSEEEDEPEEDYKNMVEAIIVIANGELLKAELSPYMMKDRPVISYQDDTVPNRLLGRGTAEKAFNMQVCIDSQMRSHLDAVALTSAPMIGMDSTRLPRGAKFEVKPGKAFFTNGNPAEILMPFKFGTNDGQAMQTSKEFERMLLMATGTMDSQGLITAGSRDAGGLAPAVSGIIKKYKRTLVNFQEDFLIPFINKCAWRRMQFDPQRYPSVDVKFVPTSTLGIIAREYEQQQMAFLMQTLGGNSPLTPVLMKGILQNSSLANREQMIADLDKMSQPDPQAQQAAQEKVQMENQLIQAQIQEISSRSMDNQAKAQKTAAEAQLMPQTIQADIMKVQEQIKLAHVQAQHSMNQEQARSTNDMSLINAQAQNEAAIKQYEAEMASRHEAEKMALEKYKIDKEAETKLMVAEMSAQASIASIPPAPEPQPVETEKDTVIADTLKGLTEAIQSMNQPKQVVRDTSGKIIGVK